MQDERKVLVVQNSAAGSRYVRYRTKHSTPERRHGEQTAVTPLAMHKTIGASMDDKFEELHARLAKLEQEHVELLAGSAETRARYTSLLQMVRELTANAVDASLSAAAASEKSLLAGQ